MNIETARGARFARKPTLVVRRRYPARGPAEAQAKGLCGGGAHWARREHTRVTRLFALILGLAVAGAALYLLVTDRQPPSAASPSPSDEIDDASRAKLERVLEEAEREGGG
jgi:hypothetical protein